MMEAKSKVVWDLVKASYDSGLLDESMGLLGGFLDPKSDLTELLGAMEEALGTADMTKFERTVLDTVIPLLKDLTNAEVLGALAVLLKTLRPVIQKTVEKNGGDGAALALSALGALRAVRAAGPLAVAAAPVLVRLAAPAVERYLARNAGTIAGGALRVTGEAFNRMAEQDPGFPSRMMDGIFKAAEGAEVRRAADTLVDSFLDRRPKLARWAFSLMTRRIKRRFSRKEEGRS
jgi:hypothetical protein